MAGASRIYGGLGAASLPLLASGVDDDELVFRDAAQELLLELLAAAINYELAAAWAKVCAALPPGSILAASTTPVADKLTLYPSKERLSEVKLRWPLLVVTRKEDAEAGFFTVDTRTLRQKWEVSWLLGPVGLAEAAKLQGALPYLHTVVERVLAKKGHVAYQSGALVLAEPTSPFLAVEATGFAAGMARVDEDGPQIMAATVTLTGIEQATATTDHLLAIDGIDLHEDLEGGTGAPVVDFVVDDTTGTPPGD